MEAAAAVEGQRTGAWASTSARVMVERRERNWGLVDGVGCSGVGGKRCIGPTEETKAMICTLWLRVRYFSAMPAAATRPVQSEVISCVHICGDKRGLCTNSFASATSAATAAGFDAVFLEVGEVCVAGTGVGVHGVAAVVFGALVFVADDHGDGRAKRDAEFGAGLDLDAVFLVTRRGECGLSRSASCHLWLDVFFCKW